jgi:hypothetical protein
VLPVGLPPVKETDEFGRPLRRPRPGLTPQARWAWLAAAAFAVLALALKLLLWRIHAPSALFGAVAAFLITAVLWAWLMLAQAGVTSSRGAFVGALVGLLTPPVAWTLFALYLLLTGSGLANTLTWILASAPATLAPAWAVAVPLAALLGVVLGDLEHRSLEAGAGRSAKRGAGRS